jgi:TPR repeat protein
VLSVLLALLVSLPAVAEPPAPDPTELLPKAEKGDVCSQHLLAEYYESSSGGKNYAKAVEWERKAAEQGDVFAQAFLGSSYDTGRGVKVDHDQAVKWYRKAAEHGLTLAEWELGSRYEHGKYGPRDYAEAAKWYRMAADRGSQSGAIRLAYFYQWGYGVESNPVEAYFWYSVGSAPWGSQPLVKLLSSVEKVAADKRIKDWRPILREYSWTCPK